MKVGDQVVIVQSGYLSDELQPGKHGEVVQILGFDDLVLIKPYGPNSSSWMFKKSELRVLNETQP
jgi:hypothetical protein